MRIDSVVVGPLFVNCFIISDENNDCVIVDPGYDFEKIKDFIESNELKPVAVLNTHGHFDHVGAVDSIKKYYGIKFYMHKDDEFLLQEAPIHAQMFGIDGVKSSSIDVYLKDEDSLKFGDIHIQVLHTPGHSPGSVSFYIKDINSVITGDTLFYESIGRTDFPYADFSVLERSIKNKLYVLPEKTQVFPGHGPFSTIGYEKKNNAFVREN